MSERDLSESERIQLIELSKKMDTLTGMRDSYGAMLDVMRKTTSETTEPSTYFDITAVDSRFVRRVRTDG